jgi:hypothetical protein
VRSGLLNIRLFISALLWMMATAASAQLRINEFLASNSASAFDPDFGVYADFIELHNASGATLNLLNYSLTDDPANPTKWRFPEIILQPNEYLLLWADGNNKIPGDTAYSPFLQRTITTKAYHLNFRLSAAGEYIGLFHANGQQLDAITFGVQERDISFGRNPAQPQQWQFFSEVTAGQRNSGFGSTRLFFASTPELSLKEGFYPSAQIISATSTSPDAVLRFTFDGSTPTENSPIFPGTFNVFRNYTIKVRAYEPGKLPSQVATKTYFIGENIALPVISISTNNPNLYGFDFGIYRNAIRDREIPAVIEYFDENKQVIFNTGIGLRVFGTTIFTLPQRPLSVRFRPRFGLEELQYQLFDDKHIAQFNGFQLRNGGNDYNISYFRDGLGVNMAKGKMDVDYQAYKPCVVFINGEFMGIYEIRERQDANYLANNHDISKDNVDLLEDQQEVSAGDDRDYKALLQFIRTQDLSKPDVFAQLEKRMDVNEYINYMIHRIFIGYKIFEVNNRYWRERSPDGKWRWLANDMEHAFGQIAGDNYWENTLSGVSGEYEELPEWSTELFSSLQKNQRFNDEFMQRFAVYLNTIYQPDVTRSIVDSMKAQFDAQMPRHILRWGTPGNMQIWNANLNFIKTFLRERPAFMRQHIVEHFSVADSALVEMKIVGKGKVAVSGVVLSDSLHSGHYFKGAGLSLLAIPEPGSQFVRWEGITSDSVYTILDVQGDTNIAAIFEAQPISIIPPFIDKDTILSAALSPWHGLEDIYVQPGATLFVEAGVDILMSDKTSFYVYGGMIVQGTVDSKVKIRANPQDWARQPVVNTKPRWGVIAALGADTLRIDHADISGSGYGEQDRNKLFAAVSVFSSPVHLSNSKITDCIQPFNADSSQIYVGYCTMRSVNSCDYIIMYNCDGPVIEYNDLRGNNAEDSDAVQFANVSNGIIRNNRIYGFLGVNSDGIDINGGSSNSLIEGNLIFSIIDKGISVGTGSSVIVRRNVIFDTDFAVALKDSNSYALIENNTFYSNNIAVSCYEKITDRGGSRADIRNTILSQALSAPIEVDNKSEILVNYSLSDQLLLSGEGNLLTDPQFVHPATANFELKTSSPAIDAGDPDSPPDPDGSRVDMGAYYTHSGPTGLTVHINEFNYAPAFNYDTDDWIELRNQTERTINLQGWSIQHGENTYPILQPYLLEPDAFVVLCRDTNQFKRLHPGVPDFIGNLNFPLDDFTGRISLLNEQETFLHAVRYRNTAPWPELAAGKGATVELEIGNEGHRSSEWRESYVLMGTPGKENSLPIDVNGLFVNEVMASNDGSLADEFGEFDDWLEVYNGGEDTIQLGGLYFSDNLSNPRKWQVPLNFPERTSLSPGQFLVLWADGQPQQGPLHTNFSLSAAGERVAIFRREAESFPRIELLSFGAQSSSASFGRFPDGSDSLSLMRPSPGASNLLITFVDDKTLSTVLVYPNPFSISVNFETKGIATPFDIRLINLAGAEIWSKRSVSEERFSMQRGQLTPGIYVYQIRDAQGRVATGKLVVQ